MRLSRSSSVRLSVFVVLTLVAAHSHCLAANLLGTGDWYLKGPESGNSTLETAPADGAPGGNATEIRFTIKQPSNPAWHIMIGHGIPADVPEGDVLRLQFWARSTTGNQARVLIEKSQVPYTSVINELITLAPDWKEYQFTGITPGFGPGGVQVTVQAGYKAGVVEIAGASVENLGPDRAYAAASAAVNAALRPAAIQARIRRYRMADITVVAHDSRGRVVPGAKVTVDQTRHAFLFGCNLFGLNLDDSSHDQGAYRSAFSSLFNYATLPFYWGSFESTQGHPQFDRLDGMVQWCETNGITPKGHPLIWHQTWPNWAPSDADSAIPLLHQRVTDIVSHYRGKIAYFDIVNEANSSDPKTGEGAWIARDGPASVVATALSWARTADPKDTFIYNDYNTGPKNVALLAALRKAGSLPDAIGIQSHMHGGVWPLSQVWRTCETFAKFGKPIHFTETTVLSGPQRQIDYDGPPPADWLTTPDGEAAQADYVAQFYTLLFSHPAVRAVTWWDLSDKNAWLGAPAGLIRRDMTPKPAYARLLNLIRRTWWTHAAGATGKDGRFTTHAFYGDYRISVTGPNGASGVASTTWAEGSGPTTVLVTLSAR